jgi:hypothetical protein
MLMMVVLAVSVLICLIVMSEAIVKFQQRRLVIM